MEQVQLILASASPRRKALLEQIGLPFKIHPSKTVEPGYSGTHPAQYATELAELKARDIANDFPNDLIIGADTIVIVDQQVLGKPKDRAAASNMLSLLSGRTHEVITAYSLQHRNLEVVVNRHVTTRVHFKPLSINEIDTYIDSGGPFDKAGAYGIQDYSGVFVDRIEGCFYNVVGFPLSDFNETLKSVLADYNLQLK